MSSKAIFKEVIRPPLWTLAFIYFLLLSLVVAIWAALGDTPALVTFIASTILMIFVAYTSPLVITCDGQNLRVGPATLGCEYISDVSVLDSNSMRLLRTRDADPAAYLALRFWTSRGVKVTLNDPRDPTPYWLVTTKRGEEIAALVRKINTSA